MQQKQRMMIAGGVVAAGLCVALLFRKPAKVEDAPPTVAVVNKPAAQAAYLAEARDFVPASNAASRTADEPAPDTDPVTAEETPPAQHSYQWVDPQPPQIELKHPGEAADPFGEHPFDADDRGGEPAKPRRKHRVRDGDTLRDLARRYLGDPSRATDILEANRDALADPEVLPIGTELQIPDEAK